MRSVRSVDTNRTYLSVSFNVWVIGFVTFLKNTSSVVLVIFVPFYLKNVLGISMSFLGFLEGVVEAISFFSRILSGVLSDTIKKRKPLLIVGYTLSLLGRIFLALSTSVPGIFMSRACERLGNGVQASPRDALVSDYTTFQNRGASFGLRNSLTVMGSVVGALLAMWFMSWSNNDYQTLFWLTLIPSSLALLLLLCAVKDKKIILKEEKKTQTLDLKIFLHDLRQLPSHFWKILCLGFFIMMSNFGIVFLIMRAEQFGLDPSNAPIIMIVQSLSNALSAFPLGFLGDHMGRRGMLYVGIVLLILGNFGLSVSSNLITVIGFVFVWGVQMGVTQNTLLSFVTDVTPAHLRGTAFGTFHFGSGIATLMANTMTGILWELFSAQKAFLFNGFIACITLLIAHFFLPKVYPTKAFSKKKLIS